MDAATVSQKAFHLMTYARAISAARLNHPKELPPLLFRDQHVNATARLCVQAILLVDAMESPSVPVPVPSNDKAEAIPRAQDPAKVSQLRKDVAVILILLNKICPVTYDRMINGKWRSMDQDARFKFAQKEITTNVLGFFKSSNDFKIRILDGVSMTFDEYVESVRDFADRMVNANAKLNALVNIGQDDVKIDSDFKPSGNKHLTPAERRAAKQAEAARLARAAAAAAATALDQVSASKKEVAAVTDGSSSSEEDDALPSVTSLLDLEEFKVDDHVNPFLAQYEAERNAKAPLLMSDVLEAPAPIAPSLPEGAEDKKMDYVPMVVDSTPAPTPLSQPAPVEPVVEAPQPQPQVQPAGAADAPMEQEEEKKEEPAKETKGKKKATKSKVDKKVEEQLTLAPEGQRRSGRDRKVRDVLALVKAPTEKALAKLTSQQDKKTARRK